MSEFSLSLTLGIVAALASLAGSLLVIRAKKISDRVLFYLIALGAGFILGTTLFDMIPGSFELSPYAPFYIAIGYFITHFFEHVFSSHFHFGKETHQDLINKQVAWTILIALLVHTFLDGVAISAGFNIDFVIGFTIFTAVILHKIPDGVTAASVMIASGRDKASIFGVSLLLALSTIAGTLWAATFVRWTALFIGVAAGVFLHIALTDLIPEIAKKKSLILALVIVLGVSLYYVTKIALISFGIA